MRIRRLALFAACPALLYAAAASAETTALRDVRVIDGSGGAPLAHATIVIDGERIVAVGPTDKVNVPAGAKVIDLAGKSVLPGLIANHAHVGAVDGITAEPKNYTQPNIVRQLKQYEAYGVTTVTALGLNRPLFYELQGQFHTGALPGADLFGADRGIGVVTGAPPVPAESDQLYRPQTPEQARKDVRETAARHPSLVKIWVDDFHGTLPQKMDPAIYKAVIEEAHKHGLRVAAHVYYLEDAKRLIAAGVDILAHGVRDQAVDAALIHAMKAHKTWYIPTLDLDESFYIYAERPLWMAQPFFRSALQPELAKQFDDEAWRKKVLSDLKQLVTEKQALAIGMRNVKTLYDAGVNVGFGTDSGATPLRVPGFAEHRELKLLTDAGLTPLQAIGTATKGAAELLGLTDRGTIAPGKLADLLVVGGDPTQSIAVVDHLEAVWHRGRLVEHVTY